MRPNAESAAARGRHVQSRIERELAGSIPALPQIPWDTILGEIVSAFEGVERIAGRARYLRDFRGGGR